MSIATLLAQHNHVTAVDVIPEKVEKINNRISPIQDDYIEKYLAEKELDLTATLDGDAAYKDADFVIIAAPTNYDPQKNFFDTTHVEEVIDLVLKVNPDAVMVIKSTIPVGYTRNLYVQYAAKGVKTFNLLFSPEFLRESKALYDNLYPSRIIVGCPKIIERSEFEEENKAIRQVTDVAFLQEKAKEFAALLVEVEGRLVAAQGVGQGERIDAHRLELRVGLEPIIVCLRFDGLFAGRGGTEAGKVSLGFLAVGDFEFLPLGEFFEVAVDVTAVGKVGAEVAFDLGDDSLKIDGLGEVRLGNADGFAQGGLKFGVCGARGGDGGDWPSRLGERRHEPFCGVCERCGGGLNALAVSVDRLTRQRLGVAVGDGGRGRRYGRRGWR